MAAKAVRILTNAPMGARFPIDSATLSARTPSSAAHDPVIGGWRLARPALP